MPKRLGAEKSVNRQNAVAGSCTSDYLALTLLGCRVIFVIIVFPYTGAVTGTEPGDEF